MYCMCDMYCICGSSTFLYSSCTVPYLKLNGSCFISCINYPCTVVLLAMGCTWLCPSSFMLYNWMWLCVKAILWKMTYVTIYSCYVMCSYHVAAFLWLCHSNAVFWGEVSRTHSTFCLVYHSHPDSIGLTPFSLMRTLRLARVVASTGMFNYLIATPL